MKQNSILRNHIQQARPTAKYTSPKIQNEILDIATSQILKAIVVDCRKAQCYAFIADESTDVEVKEQISLCARFVDKKEGGKHMSGKISSLLYMWNMAQLQML